MHKFIVTNKSGTVRVEVVAKNSTEACRIVWETKQADKRSTLVPKRVN
jgi:hypothetical protein